MSPDDGIREVTQRLHELERKHEEVRRSIWGYPDLGQEGFQAEIREGIKEIRAEQRRMLEEEIRPLKAKVDDEAQKSRDKESEARGVKRVVGYTGVSSILTLLTLVALVVAIWQGVAGA